MVGINGLAAITFMIGYLLFGLAMTRTASLPRLAGILVAVGAPAHLIGFGSPSSSPALWWIAVAGSVSLGAGLAWPGYRLSQQGPLRASFSRCEEHAYEQRLVGGYLAAGYRATAQSSERASR